MASRESNTLSSDIESQFYTPSRTDPECLYRVYSATMGPAVNSCLRFAVLFCMAVTFSASLVAQRPNPAPSRAATVLASMPHAKKIDQVALSPDGTQVAYVVDGKIMVTPLNGGAPRTISVEGKFPQREVTWSADSKQIAFLADLPGDVPVAQVWTAAVNGGAPAKRAELKGYIQTPRFSPD